MIEIKELRVSHLLGLYGNCFLLLCCLHIVNTLSSISSTELRLPLEAQPLHLYRFTLPGNRDQLCLLVRILPVHRDPSERGRTVKMAGRVASSGCTFRSIVYGCAGNLWQRSRVLELEAHFTYCCDVLRVSLHQCGLHCQYKVCYAEKEPVYPILIYTDWISYAFVVGMVGLVVLVYYILMLFTRFYKKGRIERLLGRQL